jgi:hypothetical protein
MYKIMGEYHGNQEELDSTDSFIEAEYMLGEYVMAFGSEWAIWIA